MIHAKKILHGKTAQIYHTGSGLFRNLPQPFQAARYHSLAIDRVPQGFRLAAWDRDREIMAISHVRYPLHGIQFHPESFMTTEGDLLIKNFLYET